MPQKLSNGSSPWGAQMGRRNQISEPHYPVKFHLRQLRWVDGDYDQGGAYWGNSGGTSIYHAWGDGAEFEQEVFARATNRYEAKQEILRLFPNAKFYR